MTEEDIKQKFITPSIKKSGWNDNQIRYEYSFTDGKLILTRKKEVIRDNKKRVDYLLSYKNNFPIAIIEAKSDEHSIGDGIQQGINYAKSLDVPFVYSSNGSGFLEHNMLTGEERELSLYDFPSPEYLWDKYKEYFNISSEQEKIITAPYYYSKGANNPRYYQRIAVNRTISAVVEGKKRILLIMATGTGKTYTAFQIIHRLRESNFVKKVLFLADRNILIDQTMIQDFTPFEDVMTKIEKKTMDSAYEIYLSLYQQLITNENEEIFREFSRDFFDLIIVDECHRGSAKEDSLWRRILEYFDSAVQIGLTATPKETKDVSSISYFGEPIYTYSLKQGIEDGFLAPFRVIRLGLNTDLEGWRPYSGQVDSNRNEIEDREYNTKDYDRNLIIVERDIEIAKIIIEYVEDNGRDTTKTIVFCEDVEHADRIRRHLINQHAEYCKIHNLENLVKKDSRYIMRITGDDMEGKRQLDSFIDVDSLYPTIVTTSKLLTTGVDCKTCKLIVLNNNINSMIEFKQIIGRGTRIKEEYNKTYFTIIDFKNASRLFADPDFDGEALEIHEGYFKKEVDDNIENEFDDYELIVSDDEKEDKQKREKVIVDGVDVSILSKRVQYFSDGKLITESLTDYSKKNILGEYATLDSFLNVWNSDKKKEVILEELLSRGVFLDSIREYEHINSDIDDFDLICHLAYDRKPLTRSERVNNVKKSGYLDKYEGVAREIIDALLNKYMDDGIIDIRDKRILQNNPFNKFGSTARIIKVFGTKDDYDNAVRELSKQIYMA